MQTRNGSPTFSSSAVLLIPILAAVLLSACRGESDVVAVARGASAYLWDAQQEDGGWHSSVHGIARSGQSWTAFTLFHLLQLPDNLFQLPEVKARRALGFIEAHIDTTSGAALGLYDPRVLDYPVYATSYALRTFLLARSRGIAAQRQEDLIPKMAAYLLQQQMTARRGVSRGDPAYGGWGLGSRRADSRTSGVAADRAYVDVSHTRRVVEALYEFARHDSSHRLPIDSAMSAAAVFLNRTQKRGRSTYDGGFFYTPIIKEFNKAGSDESGSNDPRSYATATCDGLLALLASGRDLTSEPVHAASTFLAAHHTLTGVAGIPESRSAWRDALFFYHLAVRAEVYARLSSTGAWRAEVLSLLRSRQRSDGSFLNPLGGPNKEDDPIIATTLALAALRYSL